MIMDKLILLHIVMLEHELSLFLVDIVSARITNNIRKLFPSYKIYILHFRKLTVHDNTLNYYYDNF